MSGGLFMVSRGIWDHPEFAPSEFSEREAFLWLVSEAAWKPRTVRAGRVVVEVERGQLCASVRFIATAWGWSKSRVDRFLKRLENRDMIGTDTGTGQLIITLCNYEKFQALRDTSGTRAGQKAGHERDTSGTNENKGNKGNKEKDTSTTPPQGFDQFWSLVPKKVGKGAARQAYAKALKKTDHAELVKGITAYARKRQNEDPQFTAHPATWLNQERWADEDIQSNGGANDAAHDAALRELDRLEAERCGEERGRLRVIAGLDGG